MNKKVVIIFFLIFYVCSFSSVFAEVETETLDEGEAYKMLYEETKDVNSKILDNVYFSLSFVGGFILLFLGSNAWFAHRSRKSEAEALKQENAAEVQNLKNDIRQELNDNLNTLKDDSQSIIEEKVKEKFKEFEREKSKMEQAVNSAKGEVKGLRFELNSVKGELAFIQGNFSSALSFYILEAKHLWETSIEIDFEGDPIYDYTFGDSLEKIHEILLKLELIDIITHNNISNFVNELPNQYSILIQKINDALEKLDKFSV